MTTQSPYVLMPRKATAEMARQGASALNYDGPAPREATEFDPDVLPDIRRIYAAMVASRPHPPGELRKMVARIIDGFALNTSFDIEGKLKAYAKADQILALLNPCAEVADPSPGKP